ncbi:MAG: Calx-beta domain-containing protein, partial [Pseudomonadota bacterium]
VDQKTGDQAEGDGASSPTGLPAPVTVENIDARQDETDQVVSAPSGDRSATDSALDSIRKNVELRQETAIGGITEVSPANVRIFDNRTRSEDAEPPLWADISAASAVVDEDSGYANFLVTLSEPAERSVVIIFSTVSLSANDEEDYLSQRGTVTFEPGVVSAEIRTPLVDDDIKEDDEQFAIVLNGAPGIVSFKSRRVTATIRDND